MATLQEIKERVKNGTLTLGKVEMGTRSKLMPVYSKTKGGWGEKLNLKTGYVKKVWWGDIESYKRITYQSIRYMANEETDRGYRISKKVYQELLKEL